MKKDNLKLEIKGLVEKFINHLNKEKKEIFLVSHFDTDGITSAAIMIQALRKLDQTFSVNIVKSLNKEFIEQLPKDKTILFLDLASGSLDYLGVCGIENIFIIDHHEITQQVPKNVHIVNPFLCDKQKISTSGLVYLFCKEIDQSNKEFAKLAILGMIGDQLEKEIDILNNGVIEDGEIKKKRGLLIYPSTRPLNRTLEYSSNPYIPGVTGDSEGVRELLREANIPTPNGKYKSLIELTEQEMQNLVTAIILRNPQTKNKELIGDIFLIKFYNKLEDARELSAMINACSRLGESSTALRFCMEVSEAKKQAETVHVKYRQHLISGLEFVKKLDKIEGKGFVIINAKNEIKDTIIGTIASILSHSPIYEEGTMIITMAYYEDKIKVSARNSGREGRNVKDVLEKVIDEIGGEIGGHEFAAGCLINQNQEKEFINLLKKNCEIELVKI